MRRVLIWILVGLVSILIIFGIIVSVKCSKLETENLKLKTEYSTIIDSVNWRNSVLEKEIKILLGTIDSNEHVIDSLKTVKQKVIVKHQYVVSKNLTESVEKLKNNLKCEKY